MAAKARTKTMSWSDAEAREALARYEGLVRSAARRFEPVASLGRALDRDDLCAEGRVAVLEALSSYGGFGIAEQTWVRTRVRQRMIDAIRRMDLRSRHELRLAVQHANGELEDDAATDRARRIAARRLVSVDGPLTDSEPMVARLEDPVAPPVDELAERSERQERLMQALAALAPRQREALELGLFEGMALREIGERMGISESRVCQLQKRAVEHLQASVAA